MIHLKTMKHPKRSQGKYILFLSLLPFHIMSHLLLFFLLLSTTAADDGAIMQKTASFLNPLPKGWSTNSSATLCTFWDGVRCDESQRVIVIEIFAQNITGSLPSEFSALTELQTVVLENNKLSGPFPSVANLTKLQMFRVYSNNFTSIPSGCFKGLTSLKFFTIKDNINLTPWQLPFEIAESISLTELLVINSNIVGSISPNIFGSLQELKELDLRYNNLTGPLPAALAKSRIKYLRLNNQEVGLTGYIDLLTSMTELYEVWLNNNQFTGPIPDLSQCKSIRTLLLQDNHLTGIVPASLLSLPGLAYVFLSNNKFQGPVPIFPSTVTTDVNNGTNNFCTRPGIPCDKQVMTLLQIAGAMGYPELLSDNWFGNDACDWAFIACDIQKSVITVNLSRQQFVGMISPEFANLPYLKHLYLNDNNFIGSIPDSLTTLAWLEVLDVSNNNLSGIVPDFHSSLNLIMAPGNALLQIGVPSPSPNAPGEGSSKNYWQLKTAIAITTAVITTVSIIIIVIYFARREGIYGATAINFCKQSIKDDEKIETFIRNYHSLTPKQYSYSDIKKMTNSFIDKLGHGGFGSVYKGKLKDGCLVAVKILNKSEGDGEGFINEVASISRTSHVNIVSLLGFCYDRSKRALVYEYMPNGSLDKFIYDQRSPHTKGKLEWKTLFEIAVGIARGLEYLHRGCNARIVHFDIKPHNILLDEDFCPKISDFGLAKLCKRKQSKVSMNGTRGTAGFIAPEVFCRNYGEVSYKSDVYSYGMMILEIVVGGKSIDAGVSHSGEIYFPDWIYKHLEPGQVCRLLGDLTEEEEETIRKMILVGLWCIQTNPLDRPSMTKAVEMLEGSLQLLPIPPKPSLSVPARLPQNYSSTTSSPTPSVPSQMNTDKVLSVNEMNHKSCSVKHASRD